MDEKRAPRVVVAEDSVLLREGLARVLTDAGFEVTGQTGDAEGLLAMVRAGLADVALVDIRMPPTHTNEGVRAAREIRANHPAVGVLVLSQYTETSYAMELISEGGKGVGYLLKDRVSDVEELADAIRRVAAGGVVIDPEIVSQLVGRRRERSPLDDLTDREREVLSLMAEGRSNQGISERLFLSPKTLETHVAHIFSKLGLPPAADDHRRVLAVLAYLRK